MKILDIDLDFFLNEVAYETVTGTERLSNEDYKPWSALAVEEFLENKCGLSKSDKVSGKCFTHHVEVFYFLRLLQEKAGFNLTFSMDHVDAHADLGLGDSSYQYIATSILDKPLQERAYLEKINELEGLSSGNFLAFAIACRWLNNLNYINRAGLPNDLQWFNFRDFDTESNIIQLKQFSEVQMYKIIYENRGDMPQAAKETTPLAYEPEVPFRFIDYSEFSNTDRYDWVFLTQSPGFTPVQSDALIPVIQQYMNLNTNA